jgi:hypothetical protein
VEGSSGACQGYLGSLPRSDCSLDGVVHECPVSSASDAWRGDVPSMALLEATKINLDNREELVVDLSTEMVEKDL